MAAALRLLGVALVLATCAAAVAAASGVGAGTTYAGRSTLALVALLTAALALAGVGVALSAVGRGGAGDPLLLAAIAVLAPTVVAWESGPGLVRSIAFGLTGFAFPLVAIAGLAGTDRSVSGRLVRALLAAIVFEAVLAALMLALFRDPYTDPSCWSNCVVNTFLVTSLPRVVRAVESVDGWLVAGAATVVVGVIVTRLRSTSRAGLIRRAPIELPLALFAAATAARAITLRTLQVEDPFNSTLYAIFLVSAAALILLSVGFAWSIARQRVERGALARILEDLGEAPVAGEVERSLARALGDPALRIVYPLADGRWIDSSGAGASAPVAAAGRTMTRLVLERLTAAVIFHATGVELDGYLGPAIRMGLENERLQAEVLAQLEDLRSSRRRIVETGDRARITLERDLHDGAQQRLLALAFDVRLALSGARSMGDEAAAPTLARAVDLAQAAIDDLRELAHGIYPAVLSEAGLGAALETLADSTPVPLEVTATAGERFPEAVEAAAYFAVAELIDQAAAQGSGGIAVRVAKPGGRLVVTIEDVGRPTEPIPVRITDRVGALGGTIEVVPGRCRVEIPCA
jgi:signal transduction histidine kinase